MSKIDALKQRLYDLNAIGCGNAIMGWDQQCLMPHGGAPARAAHQGILSRLQHEMLTSDETRRLLEDATAEAESAEDKALVRIVQRDLDLSSKIPAELVEKQSRLGSEGHETWVTARQNNDFASFAPTLETMFDMAREQAEYLGYEDHIYSALFDLYEEGAVKADADRMFDGIRGPLVQLVKDIKDSGVQHDASFLHSDWSDQAQLDFTAGLAKTVGFDFNRGRQDTAAHPFCTGWSVGDIRITTRCQEFLGTSIFGTLHEAGHGMYEQGSPMAWDRLPLAGGVSLGVHESQSRTWENIVGRSKAFWEHNLPQLHTAFPALRSVDLNTFYKSVNRVEPSLIRVEADEVTYNLHIMIRFELECALLTNELAIKDLPDAWNAKYEEYLGITPDSDANGCLQDVHWSGGMVGYFPTYSIGNVLSSQIWKVLAKDLGDVDALMSSGNFKPILAWLIENVYSKGSSIKPADLVEQVTGKPLGPEDYLDQITTKYRAVYGLS